MLLLKKILYTFRMPESSDGNATEIWSKMSEEQRQALILRWRRQIRIQKQELKKLPSEPDENDPSLQRAKARVDEAVALHRQMSEGDHPHKDVLVPSEMQESLEAARSKVEAAQEEYNQLRMRLKRPLTAARELVQREIDRLEKAVTDLKTEMKKKDEPK
jgi:hypothetical protein